MDALSNFNINELDILGKRDIDINYSWNRQNICQELDESATTFISTRKLQTKNIISPPQTTHPQFELAKKQQLALDTIITHHTNKSAQQPLRMIIQGTAGTGKSYLIQCIRQTINMNAQNGKSPFLALAPTGVAAYNIQATKIHTCLQIPIKDMHPLQGQSLTTLQEDFKHVKYILIDEVSFLGPKLLLKIDNRLREAFPQNQQ